ncbi:hypothetical protein NEPTK9_000818 [Candidatus Neptunochlamydia vexilliferae]|uniref:Uncharacterized protein n=1 Tax=Candidatus Neptunichlamydia vexilliferae TaxID=1651774 RepID=A0ABS0AYU4_9BACT|nr:hypothetical protein [Candidatus Neptunochlamydia vexilliferae]
MIRQLYPNKSKSCFWVMRKLSKFVDHKWPNIKNMRSLTMRKVQGVRCRKPKSGFRRRATMKFSIGRA